MISFQSKIFVNDVKGSEIIDFLLNCNDREYQHWWPGTHLALHTIKRCPDNVGNVIYMDEFVGKHRIRMIGIVTQFERGKKIVWQFKKFVRLPVWLSLETKDTAQGVVITHTIRAGFERPWSLFDPIFRVYLSEDFGRAIDEHVKAEFPKLRDSLHASL